MDIKFNIYQPTISASSDAARHTYSKHKSDYGTYYVSTSEFAGDNIYVSNNDKSGMAGRTLDFMIDDGTVDSVCGIWKTSASSLYESTGIDLRDDCKISYVISMGRIYSEEAYGADTMLDVLEHKENIKGNISNIEKKAQALANKKGMKLFFSFKSVGGGGASCLNPK